MARHTCQLVSPAALDTSCCISSHCRKRGTRGLPDSPATCPPAMRPREGHFCSMWRRISNSRVLPPPRAHPRETGCRPCRLCGDTGSWTAARLARSTEQRRKGQACTHVNPVIAIILRIASPGHHMPLVGVKHRRLIPQSAPVGHALPATRIPVRAYCIVHVTMGVAATPSSSSAA